MDVTKSSISINCPHCNKKSTYNISLHQLNDGQRLTCTSCGKEIVIDRGLFENVERIIDNLPQGAAPTSDMNVVKSSLSLTCPSCGGLSNYSIGLHELTDGRKVTCEHCGKEIPVDREKLLKIEQVLEHMGDSDFQGGDRTVEFDGVPVQMKTKKVSVDVSKTFNINFGAKGDLPPDMEGKSEYKPITPPHVMRGGGCRNVLVAAVLLLSAVLVWFII